MPELTVTMPAYNSEHTLRQAIRSTLRFMPRDARLLVYDDGSTDRTPEVLEREAARDKRVRWHREEQNRGVGAAVEWLLSEVDSPLFARMDSDDVCTPVRFRPTLDVLRRSGADAVVTGALEVDERLRPIRPTVPWPMSAAMSRYDLLIDNSVMHPGLICRTEAIREAGGYRDVIAEDYDLWMRMASNGVSMIRLPWQGFLYRNHSSQVTSDRDAFRRRITHSPALRESFLQLSEKLLGRRYDVFNLVNFRKEELSEAQRAEMHGFAQALHSAVSSDPGISAIDRMLYRRRRHPRLIELTGRA